MWSALETKGLGFSTSSNGVYGWAAHVTRKPPLTWYFSRATKKKRKRQHICDTRCDTSSLRGVSRKLTGPTPANPAKILQKKIHLAVLPAGFHMIVAQYDCTYYDAHKQRVMHRCRDGHNPALMREGGSFKKKREGGVYTKRGGGFLSGSRWTRCRDGGPGSCWTVGRCWWAPCPAESLPSPDTCRACGAWIHPLQSSPLLLLLLFFALFFLFTPPPPASSPSPTLPPPPPPPLSKGPHVCTATLPVWTY